MFQDVVREEQEDAGCGGCRLLHMIGPFGVTKPPHRIDPLVHRHGLREDVRLAGDDVDHPTREVRGVEDLMADQE